MKTCTNYLFLKWKSLIKLENSAKFHVHEVERFNKETLDISCLESGNHLICTVVQISVMNFNIMNFMSTKLKIENCLVG